MCEIYGFCGATPAKLNKYTNEFWAHSKIHKDGFGYFLADKEELYLNPKSASLYLGKLSKKDFTSNLALCHIRFKTHGSAKLENCHPFIKYDSHGVRWALIHNGYITDNKITEALATMQSGETDTERILMYLIESINSFYDHQWIDDPEELMYYTYIQLETTLAEISKLGKCNLIFTDSKSKNMYVYMNHPKTLYCLDTSDGIHFSTTPLSNESWIPVEPYKLHIFNNGIKLEY